MAESEVLIGILIILIIEEDSSESTGLITVLNDEVSVGPSLELRVVIGVVFVADLLVGSMEMLHVLLIDVGGSDISSSPEPPYSAISLEVTVIEMHGGSERVLRVHNTAQSTSEEGNALAGCHSLGTINSTFGGGLECLWGHRSVNNTKINSSLFENFSSREDAGHSSTSSGTNPSIFLECSLPVDLLDGLGDGNLGLTAHLLELRTHGKVTIRAISFLH
mmetsp:Transcript_7746/g.11352  ORF Transcript_7746/g.11352 Transcript_7746/m.11352 type:complete len:220 (+) Transcript_7746:425-1084(+)